ncbi:hypothetical protein BGZ50_001576, partial [Haplosporangium sp. Z 11]
MTSALRISFALAIVALTAQAAPILPGAAYDAPAYGYTDSACHQNVDSGSVDLGSTTSIVPITEITPIHRYQNYIEAYAPIVNSECYNTFGDYGYGVGIGRGVGISRGVGYPASPYDNGYDNYGVDTTAGNGRPGTLFRRRFSENDPADLTCAAGDLGCQTSVPPQTVDLGSSVNVVPSIDVTPATFYQPQVQSLESDILAAPAQTHTLPQHNVDLGSNVLLQPATH